MNWQNFQTYNESPTKAFEAFCNQLFEQYCNREFAKKVINFNVVNGSGGDGGVESYATLNDDSVIGMQAKWFIETLKDSQIRQIKTSIAMALSVRPNIKQYIVCIPRTLGDLKVGRDKKNIKNTERKKWDSLIAEMKTIFPNLEILLWDDYNLLTKLQQPECSNIHRYWFQKSELDIETLKYAFDKQKNSWLSLRYIPELHTNGYICDQINKFLGEEVYKTELLNKVKNILFVHNKFLQIMDNIYKWCSVSVSLNAEMLTIQRQVKKNILIINKYLDFIIKNSNNIQINNIQQITFGKVLDSFCEANSTSSTYYYRLRDIINEFNDLRFEYIKREIDKQNSSQLITFIGNPGTGKTHGIANCVESLIDKGVHSAILIKAKDISKADTWKDILIRTLGLSSAWSEAEIFQALEALSYRLETKNSTSDSSEKPYIIPQILICVDGLDELRPSSFWINKLRETKKIFSTYKRIKFCATTRPCAFYDLKHDDELYQLSCNLNIDGDVSVSKLFDKYIKHYNVNIENCKWLKWAIRTPLALKLFCEIYKNKTITNLDKKSITVYKLIEEKIKVLDLEFRSLCQNYKETDNIVHNALILISNYFISGENILKSDLLKILKEEPLLGQVVKSDFLLLINILEENGFLQSYEEYGSTRLSLKKIYYEKGIQPFFDYIMAILLLLSCPHIISPEIEIVFW